MAENLDPRQLSLVELRALRSKLQNEDDALSYVRRLAQARLDLVQAEKNRRADGNPESLSDELTTILSAHLTGGAPRPPRPAEDFSSHPLAEQFDALADGAGGHDLSTLSTEE
ncbi:MAG: RsiG family protein, partial [Ilumatobacteraceae bacterium]